MEIRAADGQNVVQVKRMKSKLVLVAIAALATIVAITSTATNVRAEGPFDEGWHTGESDYKNGDTKNPRCSSDIEASVCASYRSGYEAGWISASLLWPEDRQEALAGGN